MSPQHWDVHHNYSTHMPEGIVPPTLLPRKEDLGSVMENKDICLQLAIVLKLLKPTITSITVPNRYAYKFQS